MNRKCFNAFVCGKSFLANWQLLSRNDLIIELVFKGTLNAKSEEGNYSKTLILPSSTTFCIGFEQVFDANRLSTRFQGKTSIELTTL